MGAMSAAGCTFPGGQDDHRPAAEDAGGGYTAKLDSFAWCVTSKRSIPVKRRGGEAGFSSDGAGAMGTKALPVDAELLPGSGVCLISLASAAFKCLLPANTCFLGFDFGGEAGGEGHTAAVATVTTELPASLAMATSRPSLPTPCLASLLPATYRRQDLCMTKAGALQEALPSAATCSLKSSGVSVEGAASRAGTSNVDDTSCFVPSAMAIASPSS
mmetsp:Transcript_10779/g.24630  ORF Transcript_10779/g.24630 Transcript_10779/m.24630 type:complete len:216 (+) Transcript_10779:423-1070(+)